MMGLPFPEEYGGGGSDTVSFAIVVEELSKACALQELHILLIFRSGAAPIYLFGTEGTKRKVLNSFMYR